jgi:hypothetical protein
LVNPVQLGEASDGDGQRDECPKGASRHGGTKDQHEQCKFVRHVARLVW